jgi:diguanylate cyclase (GGDEF)-like protein
MVLGRLRNAAKASVAPVLGADIHAPVMISPADILDLFPVAAAVINLDEAGELSLVGHNLPFRQAGLLSGGPQGLLNVHAERIAEFIRSDAVRAAFTWELGDEIDCRTFGVTLSRREIAVTTSRCLVVLVDQTSERRTEQSLRREMQTDALTGLPNRAAFSEVIEELVEGGADRRSRHAVLMIDLARFSRVNACLGGMAGDELLISVARRVKGALRASDVLARVGGDEFGVLMSLDDGSDDAFQLARRVTTALSTPFRLSDFEIRVDCSIGIAFGDEEVAEAEEMIRHAQFAAKRAKASGRPEAYHNQAFDQVRTQFGIETQLRRALDTGQLRLMYQPICDLTDGRIVGFESLARWRTEFGVEKAPDEFIPVAEESGLIVPLGRWAIDEAARTLASWDARGGAGGVKFAVNLSAVQLQRDDIVPVIEDALGRHGVAGNRFKLELTESALVSDPHRIAGIMRSLKDLGTEIAMDDFGTGYSNLAYLQQLPIDLLKIDRSFVVGMLGDRDKIAIVKAVLSLSQALGMQTVAEGVETAELAQMLAALGCTYGQGYYYARPLEADDAYDLLVSRNA